MEILGQWRTRGHLDDAVFILDANGRLRWAIVATPAILSQFLTGRLDIDAAASGDLAVDDPADWGELVLELGSAGEVLEVEPELFWHGIYAWFRSRGVDYDSPSLAPRTLAFLSPEFSSLMDD
jgi:hypothetical protein